MNIRLIAGSPTIIRPSLCGQHAYGKNGCILIVNNGFWEQKNFLWNSLLKFKSQISGLIPGTNLEESNTPFLARS